MTQQAIADRLAQLRRKKAYLEARDVTQAEVAGDIGVSLESYSRYENGKRKVPEHAVQALATYYGVEPSFIRYGVARTEQPGSEQEGRRVPLASYQIPDAVAKALAEAQAPAPVPSPAKEATRPARPGKARGQR